MNGYGRGQESERTEKMSSVVTRETFGMTLIVFSVILLVISIIGQWMLGEIGIAINAFVMGVLGFFTYPFLLFCILLSVKLITGKKIFSWKWALRVSCVTVCAFLIVHLATSARFLGAGFGAYFGGCWNAASASVKDATGGGILFALIVYPVRALLSTVGAYVIFSLLLALSVFFLLRATPLKRAFSHVPKARAKNSPAKKAPAPKVREVPQPQEVPPQPQYSQYEQPRPSYDPRYGGQYEAPRPSYEPRPLAPRDEERQQYGREGYGSARDDRAPLTRGSVYNVPFSEGFDRYTPPVDETPSKPTDARDILFGADPAASYRNNLAFNPDHERHVRRSSVENDLPRASSYLFDRPSSYSEGYAARAETPRPQMPRKIVEQRATSNSSVKDLDYARRPSYKAADEPSAERTDFYEKDIPYEEEFTSAPTVDDLPDQLSGRTDDRMQAETPKETASGDAPRLDPFGSRNFSAPAEERNSRDFGERLDPFGSRNSSAPAEERNSRDFGERLDPFGSRSPSAPAEERNSRDFGERLDPFGSRSPSAPAEERNSRDFGERLDPFGTPPEPVQPIDRGTDSRAEERGFGERGTERSFGGEEDDAGESRAMEGFRSRADLFDDEEIEESVQPVRIERETSVHDMPSTPAPKPVKHVYRPYCPPSLDLLRRYDENVSLGKEEIERNSQTIVETLAGFRIDAEIVRVTVGPAVTRYDIDIPKNISVGNVIKRDAEIAMRLHARVNIYANTEWGAISIEVPNSVRATVGLRSILESEEFKNSKPGALTCAIGKNIEGKIICGDIVKMKHLLVAGGTGSGKSVCLNAMLISLLARYSPEQLRLILIDPKRVEFAVYDGLPHLMINEIITEPQKAVTALNWAIKEMERRYLLFEQKTRSGVTVQNVDQYNESVTEDEEKLPKILIVFDELADFMAVAKKDIEDRISRLTAKARAAGIHLIISTQRPSVDVVTGVIKTNLPTRIACRVSAEVDSRTILDESGAQKLLGNGDMLYRAEGMFNCLRLQGAFLSNQEIGAVVEDIKAHNESYFDSGVSDYINSVEVSADDDDGAGSGGDADGEEGGANGEYVRALAIVVKLGQASISLIQRKLSVGYNHAGHIIDWMELMGYISPFDGKAKARTVLLTKEEFESKYGPLD